jgi:hypothetical protein
MLGSVGAGSKPALLNPALYVATQLHLNKFLG